MKRKTRSQYKSLVLKRLSMEPGNVFLNGILNWIRDGKFLTSGQMNALDGIASGGPVPVSTMRRGEKPTSHFNYFVPRLVGEGW